MNEDFIAQLLSLNGEFGQMKGEFDQMKKTADEQAKTIEELGSLLATSRESTDYTRRVSFPSVSDGMTPGNGEANQRTMSPNTRGRLSGSVPGSQRETSFNMRGMYGNRLSRSLLSSSQENMNLDCDTFSLMMISPVLSRSWILGFVSVILFFRTRNYLTVFTNFPIFFLSFPLNIFLLSVFI